MLFRQSVKEEGFLLSEDNQEEVMTGPQEVYKQELIKTWIKSGRPYCRVIGPMGNVFQFKEASDLVKFLYHLPRLWEYLSPGGYAGGTDMSRQRTDQKIFTSGDLIAAEVRREGRLEVRYILFKTKFDKSKKL